MIMSRTGAEMRASETQSKFIQDRVSLVEKHFGQLCDTMSSITRKTARLRDKGDQLAKDITTYSEADSHNPSMLRCLTEFATNLSAIQDYRQAEVTRLDAKVVQPLSNYGIKCKQAKNDLKSAFTAQDKESKQKRKLDMLRQKNPGDRSQISQAETELQKASVEASRTSKNLHQQVDKFELEKLKDIKKMLSDFVNIEMMFHAKALEVYTQCYQNISSVDVEEDIDEFRSKLTPPNSAARMNMVRSSSYSSLNTNTNSKQTTPTKMNRQLSAPTSSQSTPTKPPVGSQSRTRIPVMDLDDDDDDDDDEDDDDEEEETEDEDDETESELSTARSQQKQQSQPRRVLPR
ncbi:protein FAM92A-like [Pecten maximus]|uniref:protein FAM92A-like n=1 Tax=Pecten maximus TaxID=6579 RepID=UPI00145834D6|nr:protein FAM92A-like [Pecten maximus]